MLKGYVKRVAELKKKTKEQLINYIIDKERKRDDKLSHYINRVVSLEDILDNWKGKNCKLRIEIAILQTQLEIKEKENSNLNGELKFREHDLGKAYNIISNHSKNIEAEILKKFNQLKATIIQELVEDKVNIIKEQLKMQKDDDILQIFEHLGVPKERVIEIYKTG